MNADEVREYLKHNSDTRWIRRGESYEPVSGPAPQLICDGPPMTFRPPEPITAEQIKDIVKEAWQELQPVGRGTVATEMPPKHETDDSDYLKAGQVAHKLNCSVRHVWRLVASGEFPKPIRLKRATRWRAVDVDEYLDRKSKG